MIRKILDTAIEAFLEEMASGVPHPCQKEINHIVRRMIDLTGKLIELKASDNGK
jgi:hypothetical protein